MLDIWKLEYVCVLFVMILVLIMKDLVEELVYLGSVMRMLLKVNVLVWGKILILIGVIILFYWFKIRWIGVLKMKFIGFSCCLEKEFVYGEEYRIDLREYGKLSV